LYELRTKIYKYKPKYIQLLESSDDFPLPVHLQSKYQTYYNHVLYGVWPSSMSVSDVGTKVSFFGNSYMISKPKIDVANLGLFIISRVPVLPKTFVTLMSFCGPLYSRLDYLNIGK